MEDQLTLNRYIFRVTLSGIGKTPEQAWEDATEQFAHDHGPTPGPDEYEVEEAVI
jgi:hypothetical protein